VNEHTTIEAKGLCCERTRTTSNGIICISIIESCGKIVVPQVYDCASRIYSPIFLCNCTFFPLVVQDSAVVSIGSVKLQFIHTPGHTPGSQCIHIQG
jgi:hypothetical protein